MIKKYLEFIKEQQNDVKQYRIDTNSFIIGNLFSYLDSSIDTDIHMMYREQLEEYEKIMDDDDFNQDIFRTTVMNEMTEFSKLYYLKPLQKLNLLIKDIVCDDFFMDDENGDCIFFFLMTASKHTPILLAQRLQELDIKYDLNDIFNNILNQYDIDYDKIKDNNFDDTYMKNVKGIIDALMAEDYLLETVGLGLSILLHDVIKQHDVYEFITYFRNKHKLSEFLKNIEDYEEYQQVDSFKNRLEDIKNTLKQNND